MQGSQSKKHADGHDFAPQHFKEGPSDMFDLRIETWGEMARASRRAMLAGEMRHVHSRVFGLRRVCVELA